MFFGLTWCELGSKHGHACLPCFRITTCVSCDVLDFLDPGMKLKVIFDVEFDVEVTHCPNRQLS